MMRYTDMADELFGRQTADSGAGVRLATLRQGGVTVTRVEIARDGLARPRGRYVTLETPSLSLLDERDNAVIELAAAELDALLPPEGPVLVLGVGNRRVTADALGPRTVQQVLVTMGAGHGLPLQGIRPVAAVAPGVSQAAGISLQALAGVPVVAAGVPTLMEAAEGKDLVVTPRALDSVIAHGAALLGSAINRALQPRFTINQLCWLAGR